jgi:quercetin dioxygenase-like cupin family protein
MKTRVQSAIAKSKQGKRMSKSSRPKSRAKGNGGVRHHMWSKIELEQMNPRLQRQLVTGTGVMLARVLLKKGCVVPLHSHPNEQLSYVVEGTLKFTIQGNIWVVRSGEVLTIPSRVPHQVKALRNTVTLDIFHPPRMDWINKTDGYLRK